MCGETIPPKKRLKAKLTYKNTFPSSLVFEEQNKFRALFSSSSKSEGASKKSLMTNPNIFEKKMPPISAKYCQLNPSKLLQNKPPNSKLEETIA